MFMKDIIKSCMKPWFSIYPWRGTRKINVHKIGVRENWMCEKKMREIWSWAKIKWIKVYNFMLFMSSNKILKQDAIEISISTTSYKWTSQL